MTAQYIHWSVLSVVTTTVNRNINDMTHRDIVIRFSSLTLQCTTEHSRARRGQCQSITQQLLTFSQVCVFNHHQLMADWLLLELPSHLHESVSGCQWVSDRHTSRVYSALLHMHSTDRTLELDRHSSCGGSI